MRVAFVHDWLVTYRGGEKVLNALLPLYPNAPVYTLFYDKRAMPSDITERQVIAHPMLSRVKRLRKALLPFLPTAIESFDLSQFDLIISTSSCVAKGAVKAPHAKHLCYIHSPMRYIWDQQDEYLASVAHIPLAQWGIRQLTPGLRAWDVQSAGRVDRFIANSTFVANRVKEFYNRDAPVVHPPIDVELMTPYRLKAEKSGYLLAAGALVSYKRFDLAIAAAEMLGKRLVIAGSGPMEDKLRRYGSHLTEFVISPRDDEFRRLLAGADALLFPGVEDFGMVAVEAMAAGTPVIAYAKGGARDFIVPGVSGMFFNDPTADSLVHAIRSFDLREFDGQRLAEFALRFNRTAFLQAMSAHIAQVGGSNLA